MTGEGQYKRQALAGCQRKERIWTNMTEELHNKGAWVWGHGRVGRELTFEFGRSGSGVCAT